MIDLNSLNSPQKEAAMTTDGPLLILAGAGSGKTRVLTHRAAYLIEEKGVNPWNILCITFTNKAAKEMRERVDSLVGVGANEVMVSTFHSLCLRILFKYADHVGFDPDFEICDATDQKSVIKEVCKKLSIDTKQFKERSILGAISSAKDELTDPVEYMNMAQGDFRKEVIARAYMEYQEHLKRNNSFDFDDLIVKVVELFKKHPEVLERYQDRYQYIMVDEYQDTNTAQFELIRLLALKYKNLCVVGDDDQSIYRFRGANIYNILNFEKHFDDARVIRLEQNYRSTKVILEAANEVISNNLGRKVKQLWTENEDGEKIIFRTHETAAEEAMYVAEDIRELVQQGKAKYGDCAILMRTNIQSKEFEDAFRLFGIDYDLVKGLRFWDTKVVKDLTSYLVTVASGLNDMRTQRIINLPRRGIGAASVEKVMAYAVENEMSLMLACEEADKIPGLGRSAAKILDFAKLINDIRAKQEYMKYDELLDEIIDQTDYMAYLDDEAETPEKYHEMTEYIEKLKEALRVYQENTDSPDIIDFMRQNGVEGNNINASLSGGQIQGALTEEEEKELREKKVLIMTMHNAKGLEFPYVYLVGMEDGLFPSYMTLMNDDIDELEEERRLCYVAITRAMKRLTITAAKRRMVNGETRYSKTSQFVKEIPFGLLDMQLPGMEKSKNIAKPIAAVKKSDNEIKGMSFGKKSSEDIPIGIKQGFGSLDNSYLSGRKKVVAKKKPAVTAYSAYGNALKGSQIGVKGELEYKTGDRVRHIKFGEGTVLEITAQPRDYEVCVEFDKAGIKRMYAGFAKLKKV